MIFAHCLQFFILQSRENAVATLLSEYINLTTFSGFMFSFGFVCWHAYINKPFHKTSKSIAINFFKILAAFYISSFAFRIFIDKMPVNQNRILEILLIKRLAGWSEFLLSFAAVLLLVFVFHGLMQKAGSKLPHIIGAISIAACLLPIRVSSPLTALFLGQADFPVFAVLPYCLYFTCGILFAQKDIRKANTKFFIVGAAGFACFSAMFFISGLPSRFPLSFAWLVGAMPFVYMYYLMSIWLKRFKQCDILQTIGANSLFYLLLSNVFIFALRCAPFFRASMSFTVTVFFVIVCAIYYLQKLVAAKN